MGHKSVLIRETIPGASILTRDDPKWSNWDLFMYEHTQRKPMILLGTLNGECLCMALFVCVCVCVCVIVPHGEWLHQG